MKKTLDRKESGRNKEIETIIKSCHKHEISIITVCSQPLWKEREQIFVWKERGIKEKKNIRVVLMIFAIIFCIV